MVVTTTVAGFDEPDLPPAEEARSGSSNYFLEGPFLLALISLGAKPPRIIKLFLLAAPSIAVTGVKCDLQKDIMYWRKRYIEQTYTCEGDSQKDIVKTCCCLWDIL